MLHLTPLTSLIRVAISLLAAALVAGCGSVYKSYAQDVINAHSTLESAVNTTSKRLSEGYDSWRFEQLASNEQAKSCGVRYENGRAITTQLPIYFISPEQLKKYIAADPTFIKEYDDCKAPRTAPSYACLSYEEFNCAKNVSEALLAMKGNESKQKLGNELRAKLLASRYPNARLMPSALISDGLKVTAEYVSVLATLAQKNDSVAQAEAKRLKDNLTKFQNNLNKIGWKDGAEDVGAAGAKLQGLLNPIVGLIGTVDLIIQDAEDAHKIRKHVKDGAANFNVVLSAIKPFIPTDAILAEQLGSNELAARRDAATREFFRTPLSEAKLRRAHLADAAQAIGTIEQLKSTEGVVTNAIEALEKAHSDLVRLVNDPNRADKKMMLEATMANLTAVFNASKFLLAAF